MNCAAENCVNNDKGLCVVESMLSICEDSKCALYQTSPEKQIMVLTKKVEMLTKELKRSCEENEELMKQIEELKKGARDGALKPKKNDLDKFIYARDYE